MEKIGFVVSVGTSLLRHYERWLVNNINISSEKALLKIYENDVENEYLDSLVYSIEGESKPLYPSAEIQTLALFFKDNSELMMCPKHIILIPVKGTESVACATLLKSILSNANTASCILGSPAKVDMEEFKVTLDDDHRFSIEVAGLIAKIRDFADYYQRKEIGCERVVICISAGYKVLIPYLSLLGFIDGHEVIYAHRSSNSVITIPQLPFNWDLRTLDEYRILLMTDDVPASVYYTLPRRIKSFYEPKSQKKQEEWFFGKSAYGKMISQDYLEERRSRFGWGETLLSYFSDENARKKIQGLIVGEWEYLWLGDQIPETVEHTRRHSSRLMELARELFQLTTISLDDQELFCLIASFWLHDIGHTALISNELSKNGGYFPLYLFPSLVRELHHTLSGEQINNLDCLDDWCQNIVEAISRYHRRKMPLVKNQVPYKHWLINEEKRAMEVEIEDADLDIKKDRLLLLTAILRFLDGCDVQADRVINKDYQISRQKRTDREIFIYSNRLSALVQKLNKDQSKICEQIIEISQRLNEMIENGQLEEGATGSRKKLRQNIQELAYEIYKKGDEFGYLEILSLADNILFKHEQEQHFLKHGGIECVYLGSPRGDGCYTSDVPTIGVYILARDTNEESGTSLEDSVDDVAKDIWGEYEAVAPVLQEYFKVSGIYLNTGYDIRKVHP